MSSHTDVNRFAITQSKNPKFQKSKKPLKGKCLKPFHWLPSVLEVDGICLILFLKGDI